MSEPILFSRDPVAGVIEYFHDLGDGEYAIETRQDVTTIVEANKAVQNVNTGRWGDMAMVAQIPLVVLEGLKRQGIIDNMFHLKDEPRFRAWLNDHENRHFRVKLGKV